MKTEVTYRPTIEAIEKAALNLKEVALKTPLVKNDQYSQKYHVDIKVILIALLILIFFGVLAGLIPYKIKN